MHSDAENNFLKAVKWDHWPDGSLVWLDSPAGLKLSLSRDGQQQETKPTAAVFLEKAHGSNSEVKMAQNILNTAKHQISTLQLEKKIAEFNHRNYKIEMIGMKK